MRSWKSLLLKNKTVVNFVLSSWILLGNPHGAFSQRQCHLLFEKSSQQQKLQIPLIKMSSNYIGENKGAYVDPITKQKWKVIYFTEAEKQIYEVFYSHKLFWNFDGKKANSEFDPEALSFSHSLIVIDRNFRIYTLPFEERGKYHHSSLSAGEDVLFAGTVAFSDGQMRELSDLSGHYKPTAQQTLLILKELNRRGVDLSKLKLSGRIAQEIGQTPTLYPDEVRKILSEGY